MVGLCNIPGKIYGTVWMVTSFEEEFGNEGTLIVQSYGEIESFTESFYIFNHFFFFSCLVWGEARVVSNKQPKDKTEQGKNLPGLLSLP